MNRRQFLFSSLVAASASGAAPARPNFLFLIADQMRADALACSGNTFCRTPSLDALAAGGVRFSNAYSTQALCTPSRGALMSGVYPHTSHLFLNVYGVPNVFKDPKYELSPNWPTLLRQAGYYTGYIGKWHLGEENPGLFDFFSGYNSMMSHWTGKPYESEYRSDMETRQAIEFLDQHGSKPFVLCVSYYPPHNPYDPPKSYENYYREKGIEHPDYYGAVTAIDHDLGLVIEKLKKLGLDRNTFVSFTADHGETFGQRLGSENKTVSYDDSAKVPLILRWPESIPAGLVYEGGMTTIDLMPTMLEAAGLPIPKRLQGKSRLGEIHARDLGWKAPVFLENIPMNPIEGRYARERAVRTQEWKLLLRDHPRDELYNIKADPGEKNDLFHDPAQQARVRELARLIKDWGEKFADPIAVKLAGRYA